MQGMDDDKITVYTMARGQQCSVDVYDTKLTQCTLVGMDDDDITVYTMARGQQCSVDVYDTKLTQCTLVGTVCYFLSVLIWI